METFELEPSKLNTGACPFEDDPEPPETEEIEAAEVYISRLYRTDTEHQDVDASSTTPSPIQE